MRSIHRSFITSSLIGCLFTSCKKDCNMTPAIIVDAGKDQTIQLPVDSVNLKGTVTSGQSPTLVYSWTFISGPSTPVIANSSSTLASVNNLVVGTYIFQFEAMNSAGTLIGLDTTSVNVLPANIKTLVLQPSDNLYEGDVNVHAPDTWLTGSDQLYIESWTDLGAPFTGRVALKFDYSAIPSGATIDTATLYLYSDPNPINGDKVNAQEGSTDAFYIQRLTSNWTLPNPFTWDSQPTTTTANEVLVPQSVTSSDNAVADVTALVKDQQTGGNNGFYMVLQNEVIYNVRQYVSSFGADPTLHPKLVISYH
jgi:hypothetical protein